MRYIVRNKKSFFKGLKLPLILRALYFIFLAITFTSSLNAHCKETWNLVYKPKQRVVKTIATYKEKIFIGTENGVLVSKDEGKSWAHFGSEKLLKDSNGNSAINWIYIDEDKEKIFIATNFGAYFSDIRKPEWKIFFNNTKTDSNIINSITVNDQTIYLSTNDGFWVCNYNENKENTCKRLNNGIEPDPTSGNYLVFFILKDNNDTYLAASTGIYFLDKKNNSWIYLTGNIQKLPDGRVNAKHLVNIDNGLWAACGTGVYVNDNKGNNWHEVTEGIKQSSDGFQEAFYLYNYNNRIFLASANGTYYLDDKKKWFDFSEGIREKESTKNVYQIISFKNNLFAATDEGLFARDNQIFPQEENKKIILKGKIEKVISNLEEIEPGIIEVQKHALKFASLPTNSDYKRYRLLARIRNLIPRVGFDINSTGSNTNYYQFEKGISTNVSLNNSFDAGKIIRLQDDGGTFKQFSVVWNTHELFYDDEIREILNQARLTANIRENILDDVTRIYFQRRKLQLDSVISENNDLEKKLEKELEIAQLTGQLDSRTGGWFSNEKERRKREH